MIQRIQSIYLAAAAIFTSLIYFMPLAIFTNGSELVEFYSCHFTNVDSELAFPSLLPLAVLPLVSIFLSLIAIFSFKKRLLQLKLGKINLFSLIIVIGLAVIYFMQASKILNMEAKPGFISIFPVIALVLVFMANRAIKKDDNLIKSADRIR